MAYELVQANQIVLAGTMQQLSTVAVNLIGNGQDSMGTGADKYLTSTGLRFRNFMRRSFSLVQNMHPFLNGYVRIITTRKVQTLNVADAIYVLPPKMASPLVIGPFSDLFHESGTITETVAGKPITRTYTDFVLVDFAHDASDPTDMLAFGVMYV